MSQAEIIEQENAAIRALLDTMNTKNEAFAAASRTFEAEPSPDNTKALDVAIHAYYHAADDVARYIRSLVRAGYRLTLPEGSE